MACVFSNLRLPRTCANTLPDHHHHPSAIGTQPHPGLPLSSCLSLSQPARPADMSQRERSRSPRRRSRSPGRQPRRRSYSPRSRSNSRDDYRRNRDRSPMTGTGAPGGGSSAGFSGQAPHRSYEERAAAREQMMNNIRETSQQDRRVYVGNLSYDVKWHHLKDFMRQGTNQWMARIEGVDN